MTIPNPLEPDPQVGPAAPSPQVAASLQVAPYRFTEWPREVAALLVAAGLRVEVSRGDWVELVGAAGRIGVHPLASAEVAEPSTSLCLQTADARVAAEELAIAGHRTRWWDESFGRQAAVVGPHGEITVNEAMRDLHGYHSHEPDDVPLRHRVDVVAVCSTPDLDTSAAFFAQLGFHGREVAPGWWPLRGPGTAGVVGLHTADEAPVPGDSCGLALLTDEPLDIFCTRVRELGHEVVEELHADAPHVTLVDPDGVRIEVHHRGGDGAGTTPAG